MIITSIRVDAFLKRGWGTFIGGSIKSCQQPNFNISLETNTYLHVLNTQLLCYCYLVYVFITCLFLVVSCFFYDFET